jgi:hypothetical protein
MSVRSLSKNLLIRLEAVFKTKISSNYVHERGVRGYKIMQKGGFKSGGYSCC